MVVSSFAIGALAIPVFDLGFVDSLLTIFFINCLGITPVAFFSTFGPRFGLRQMVLSRYFFGFYGVKISKWLHDFHPIKQPPRGAPYFQWQKRKLICSSRLLQRTRLCRLVCRQCDSRCPTYQRCEHQRPRICWHHHHSRSNMASHCLRLPSCTPLRSLVMDPIHHHLPHCPGRICPQRPIQQLANGSRHFRGRKHSIFCCKRVRLRHGLDKLCGRLHSLSACERQPR